MKKRALFLALGLALLRAGAARGEAPFSIGAPLAGRAIFGCTGVTVTDGATVRSEGVSSYSAKEGRGHVASNGDIFVSSRAVVMGDVAAGPGHSATVTADAAVSGLTTPAAAPVDCRPVDLAKLAAAIGPNDNAKIPKTALGKSALGGAAGDALVLGGRDSITLAAGTYVFSSIDLSGRSHVALSGEAHVLVAGDVHIAGNSALNPAGGAFRLRLFMGGGRLTVESLSTVGAFVYAPSARVLVDTESRVLGTLFASAVEVRRASAVVRVVDDTPPVLTLLEPNASGAPVISSVRVRGFARDPETAVTGATLNGRVLTLQDDGSFDTTVDATGSSEIRVDAENAMGLVSTVRVLLCSGPPALTIESPANGSLVGSRVGSVTGTCGTATSVTVNRRPAFVANGAFRLDGFDFGSDGIVVLDVVASSSCAQSTRVTVFTLDTEPPAVAIDTPISGSVVGASPVAVGGTYVEPNLASITVNGIAATISGNRFTAAAVPIPAGTSTLVAEGRDKLGHVGRSAPVDVTLDTQAPSVVITSPASGSLTGDATATVSGTADVPGLASVRVAGRTATLSGKSFTVSGVPLVEGDNRLVAEAIDASSRSFLSPPVVVTLDSLPPVVALDPTSFPPLTNRTAIAVSGTVSDPHLGSVTVNGVAAVASGGRFTAANVPLMEGDNAIRAHATDTLGHASDSAPATVTRDTQAPAVTITSPAAGAQLATASLTVTGTASDPHLAGVTVNGVSATLTNGAFTASLTLPEGDSNLVASAVDSLGNAGASAAVPVTVDTQAPVVSIDPPVDSLTGSAFVTVTGTVVEPHLLSVTVSGVPAAASGGRFVATNVPLVEGTQQITAVALDTFGHRGESAPVTYRLDSMPPALTIDKPPADSACFAPGAPIAVSGHVGLPGTAGVRPAVSLLVQPSGGTAQTFAAILDAAGTTWSVAAVDLGSSDGLAVLTASTSDALGHDVRVLRSVRLKASVPAVSLLLDGGTFPGSAAGATAGPGETPVLLGRAVRPRALVTDGPGAAPPTPVLTLDGAPYAGAAIDAEGTHLLAATATDCAGHSASRHALFTIDVTPPRLLSTAPPDGATLGAAVTAFSGTSDPDLASATVDGMAAAVSGGAFSVAPFSSKEGTNALTIVLVDRAGNRSVFSRSFNVKSLAPSVAILEGGVPLGSGATFFRAVTPVVRSSDPSATVTATLNGSAFVSGTPVSAAGRYTMSATATDGFGHVGSASASFTIDLSAAPTIDITTPPDRAVLAGPAIAVTGTASTSVTSVTVNGRTATLAGAAWTLTDLVLPPDVPAEIIAIGSDSLGRTATATRQVTVRSAGPQVQILDPPDGFRTNRKKIDVVGAVVGGPSMTADGSVVVAGATLPLDALGGFRAKDVLLADGANTLVASATDALGRTGTAQVVVTTDTLAPLIAITAGGQPLVEGASFARPFSVHVEITDNTVPLPIPVVRLNGQDQGATAAVTDLPITQNGGYILSVVARDAAGNESRADRSFVLASGGCSVSGLDPADGTAVAASSVTLHGKSGDAQAVSVSVGGQTFAAQLADGTFAAGGVPLPAVGDNTLQIACTDRSGATTTTNLKLTRLPDGSGPAVRITAPANGARQSAATVTVAGTVSDPSAAVTVNGVGALVAPVGTFSVASLPLVEGPNVLAARALDAAGRSGEDRVVAYLDSAAPKISITSPPDGAHVGLPGAGPAAVTVTGAVDLTVEPNLASVVVASAAGSVTATVDPDSGAFFASGVPLVTSSPGTPQTLTATATDTLSQRGTASVSVVFDPAAPALVLSQPVDLTRYTEASPPSFTAAGEAWARDGAQISLNGGGLDPATLSWDAPAADGRRHTAFSAQVTVPDAEGPFGLIARVEEPSGAYANDRRVLYKDVTAPKVIELSPADGARQVDANEIPLALFSEPVKPSTLGTADGLTLTRVTTGDKAVGTFTIAGNAVAFAPGAALARGEVYLFRAGPGVTDLAGHPLAAAVEARFTVAALSAGAAPALDPIPAVLCATQLAVTGTAAPNAAVRLRDGDLTFTGNADSAGRFTITIPLSGNGFHAVHAAILDRDGVGASPEATVLFRVDCSTPSVLGAAFDRSTGKITVAFSEAMGASSLTLGGTGSAITVSKADDATHAPQAAALALSPDGATAALDLGSAPGAWWQSVSVRLQVGPPAADASGNVLGSSFETVFFAGGGGDLSGGFLSGEAYDDESGRPLAGASVALFASGAALPGSVPAAQVSAPVASTVTDGRGRFSLVGDVAAGRYALVLSRSGYSRAVRRLALEPAVGAVPFDSRLTPLADQAATLLHAATGGNFAGPAGAGLSVAFAPGALSSAVDLGVRLTGLSGQGLPEPLPLGWTPLAAAEVRLIPAGAGDDALPEGAGTPFSANAAHLTLTLPDGVPSNADLFAARYDVAAGAWLALPIPVRASGAGGADTVTVGLAGPGAAAVILADSDPATRPAVIPTSLDAPLVGSDLPSSLPTLTAAIGLDPALVSPTGRATARVVARSTDGTTPWPSGLAVQAYLDEKLILSGGGELYEAPFSADLILYHPPLAPADVGTSAPGAVGSLTFRISPSPRAVQVLLDTGYENVRLFPFTDQLERGQVLGPSGGSVSSADGVELFVPESALAQKTVVQARLLSSSELAALPVPAGFTVVAGVRVDLSGQSLARGATLRLNAPASLPADASDDPRLVLASFVDQPDDGRGAFARVIARVSLLPAAGSAPAKLVGAPEASGSTLPLNGITGEGVFLVLHANAPIGFATGRVTAPNGAGYAGSRVTAQGLGTADLSQPGGPYAVCAPAGSPTLTALHPTLGVSGTAQVPSLAKGQVAQIDIVVAPTPPRIVSLQPPAGATSQPVGTTIAILFSAPLDPASVLPGTIQVSLADDAGAPAGLQFAGNVSLSPDKTTVVFTPVRPLPPGRRVAARLAEGVRDAVGTAYGGALPVDWSFTTSTQFVTGGSIHPEKIRLLLPVNGVAQVIGDPGALPSAVAGTTPWAAWADVDGALACPTVTTVSADGAGGFAASAGCPPTASVTLASRVYIHILDPTGTEAATFKLGPFVTPDGKGFVAPPGEVTVFITAEGIEVTAPAAAFDAPTLVRIAKIPVDSLGVAVNPGMEMGAALNVDFDGTAKETLRLRVPVTTSAPSGGLVFAGSPIELPWGRKLRILDVGRLVTDSSGNKVVSTADADQPDSSSLKADGRQALTLPKKLVQTIFLEMRARAAVALVYGLTAPLMGVSGVTNTVGASFFVLYNALADAFVFLAVANNWQGQYILPAVAGSPFSVVKRDAATGWILAQHDYPAQAATAGITSLGTLDPSPTTPPMLLSLSPFRVLRFTAPPVDSIRAVDTLRLSLELEARVGSDRKVSLHAVPTFPLADRTSVELFNFTQATSPTPAGSVTTTPSFVANGTFTENEIAAVPGDDLFAFVMPGELDPNGVGDLTLTFSRGLVDTGDPASLVVLTDCGALPDSVSSGPPPCSGVELKPTADLSAKATQLTVHLPGRLANGHQYRLELKNVKAGFDPIVDYPNDAPSTFFFSTTSSGTIVGRDTGQYPLGDTYSARDLLKFESLLLVGSATGRVVAVDVSDPSKPTPFARLNAKADAVRAFATDGHGRLFYSAQFGWSWAIETVRIEDVREHAETANCPLSDPAWASSPPPCFASMPGGIRTAFAPGSLGTPLASDYLALVGTLPTGTPSSMEVLVRDDFEPPQAEEPYGLRELYEKQDGHGPGSFDKISPKPEDGFYEFDVALDTASHLAPRPVSSCGADVEKAWDHFQRVSIDDLSTGHTWSTDIENRWPNLNGDGKGKIKVRAREGDRLRIRYNVFTLGYLAIVGSGISVVDLNRGYRNPAPAVDPQRNKSECDRRLGKLEGDGLSFYAKCPPPATVEEADPTKAPRLEGLQFTPALAVVVPPEEVDPNTKKVVNAEIHVYSVLTHMGSVHSSSTAEKPGTLAVLAASKLESWQSPEGAVCFGKRVPSPLRASYRAVALAKGVTWTDRGITPGDAEEFKDQVWVPLPVTGDLLFYSLGQGGILSFRLDSGGRAAALIGRYWAKDHSVYRLQADSLRGLLFAGGQDKDGNPIIDIWDIGRANGGPTANGVFPPTSGEAIDPRLLATLKAPWDTNHIGLDDTGLGLIYTWGYRPTPPAKPDDPPGKEEGGFAVAFDSPSFVFSGLYRRDTAPLPPAVIVPSRQRNSPTFDPLGVPLRLTAASEATHEPADETCASDEAAASGQCHTAAFKVRVALPGPVAGEAVTAKVQTLRGVPDHRLLGQEDVGPLVALCGGVSTCDDSTKPSDSGWPDRDVWVTLRRLGKSTAGPDGPTTNPYELYESDEIVVLVADPRARAEYWSTVTAAGATTVDEKSQCRRCDRPPTLSQDPKDPKVLELLAGGPYVRAVLSAKQGSPYEANTIAAIRAFNLPGYGLPSGLARLSGFADEVPSSMQIALAEPAQNPAVWAAEAGASVRLTSGEGVVETRDFSAPARTLGFAFDRTYRSGVLGYGPLGASGWNASLFAHLREIPLAAEPNGVTYVDYHDGAGQVWRFVGLPDKTAACPAGTERDVDEDYCTPVGLYVELKKETNGRYLLTGRNHDRLRFDESGRLVEISDRFAKEPQDVGKKGSTVKLFYTPAGDLARVEDEMGRVYRFSYNDDPKDPDLKKASAYGLLRQIEDFATPARTVKFTYDLRRLDTVTLPDVTSKLPRGSHSNIFVKHEYLSGKVLSPSAPLHGAAFSKAKLLSYTLPGSVVPRIKFDWDASNGHVSGLTAPEGAAWSLDFTEKTAVPVTGVKVTEPSGLLSTYELTDGRVTHRSRSFPVSKDGQPPASTVVSDSASYKPDGRFDLVTRGDGGTTTFNWPKEGLRLNRLNAESAVDNKGLADSRTSTFGYQGDNYLQSIADSLSAPRTTLLGVAEAGGTDIKSGFPTDGVQGSNTFDNFGRAIVFTGDQVAVSASYGKDLLGREGGFPDTVSQGPLSQTFGYDPGDQRGNPTTVTTSWGTSTNIEYDEWDRPVKETSGLSTGGYETVGDAGDVVERAFDEAGHLATERRTQKGLGPVQTDYVYDDRERLKNIQRTQVAGADPGSIAPLAETNFYYDTKTGLLTQTTSAAGVVTMYEFDEMGRLKTVTPPHSGTRQFGYDEMGRLTYATDGDDGVWTGKYDAWGGLVREQLPTGAVITRAYDAAGGLLSARLNDGAGGGDLAVIDNVYVTSFGETKSLTQRQSTDPAAPALEVSRDFDGNGRLLRQTSSGRKDLELTYEAVTGRVTGVADSVRQLTLDYKGKPAPWADGLSFGEAQTGAGGFVPTVTSDILSRDAYGRATVESRSDGSVAQAQYDEAGNPLSIVDGASATALSWDSRGNLIDITRPGPQGATTYGYDLDGRLVKKHSTAGGSGQAYDTSYDYEAGTGRLQAVRRPDGATETYHYYPDDTVQSVAFSDGTTVSYKYDAGNRVTKRTGAGGSVLPGGETFTWDLASRLAATSRVDDKGDPIPGTAVTMTAYDLAGRPHAESVGARPALTRDYDVFGHVTSLGLPAGIGTFGALSYLRAYEAGTQRLASLTATGDAPSVSGVALASLGAKWAWLGDDRVLGVTTNGPLGAAHRFGYVGGPAGPSGAAKWKLGTLTIGTAGGSDPFNDAGIPLGDSNGKGSKPWGQFAYGYVTGASGDGTKLGRAVTGTGLPLGSILAGQGWAYGIDPSKRLTRAFAGPGDIGGIDAGGAAAAIAAFEKFRYDYGTADQLLEQSREVAAKSVRYETGGEGRPDSRQTDPDAAIPGPKVAFSYDGMKRRTSDDRFDYTWHWHGKLASATVKSCWPIENGESQDPTCAAGFTRPPYAGQKIVYDYDALGRLLTRTHLGPIPPGKTDADRPFIEKRAYLWDDKVLLAETAYSDRAETLIRWRKSYIPGASLDDHVQLRVETYDLTGRNVGSDRLYSYLRDEQGSVLGLADETSDPARPSIPVRYVYTPYGDAHAETGPELRKAAYVFSLTSLSDATGATKTQISAGGLPGGVRLSFGTDVDISTFVAGVVFERRETDGTWAALNAADIAIGRATDATNRDVDVLPLSGFAFGTSYRARTTSSLRDISGRSLAEPKVIELAQTPALIPPDQIGASTFEYERSFPVNYDSYFASGTDAGLFPGGQPMLFQGAWTDPITGLQYKRARWYDARNASFLSSDPMGDQDSPNLYGYVGGRPHEKTDPLGLCLGFFNGEPCSATAARADRALDRLKAALRIGAESDAGAVVEAVTDTVIDAAKLFVVDPLRAGEATGTAIGSGAGAGETALAVVQDVGRAAALAGGAGGVLKAAGRGAKSVRSILRAGEGGAEALSAGLGESAGAGGQAATRASRIKAIREALSDANGHLLPSVERTGIKAAIRNVEGEGYELLGSVKYRGNQGIDLTFRGVGENAGRFALAEAKASSGLGALGVDSLGIRQGSYEFFRTRLARGIAYGDSSAEGLYREIYGALRSGNADLFANFAGSDRLFHLDPGIFQRYVNFRTAPGAATLVK